MARFLIMVAPLRFLTDGAGHGKILSYSDDKVSDGAGISIGGGDIERVGDSSDEGTENARNAIDSSDNSAVSNTGGVVLVPTDGAGHGKVPSFSDDILQKRDHIDAIWFDESLTVEDGALLL
jgi:hypothetical protein